MGCQHLSAQQIGYHGNILFRFLTYALPLLVLLLALFGFVVEFLDLEPSATAVIRLALLEPPKVPATVVLSTWIMEACGLLALYLLAQGRCGTWWMDGLVAGWLAWVFRGPLLVLTIVVAVRQPQDPWWELVFAWWWLYSICGLSLAILAKRSNLAGTLATVATTANSSDGNDVALPPEVSEVPDDSAIAQPVTPQTPRDTGATEQPTSSPSDDGESNDGESGSPSEAEDSKNPPAGSG